MMKMLSYANQTAPGYSKYFYRIQAGEKYRSDNKINIWSEIFNILLKN